MKPQQKMNNAIKINHLNHNKHKRNRFSSER